MIIGQFNDSFPPAVDGVANVIVNYCNILNQNNNRCYAIVPNYEGIEKFDFNVLKYKSMPVPFRNEYRFAIPCTDYRLLKELKRIEFDILHAHCPATSGWYALWLARNKKIPLIATFHSQFKEDLRRDIKSEALIEFLTKVVIHFYNQCDEVWVVNESTGNTLREYGYEKDYRVVNNGCEFEVGGCSSNIMEHAKNNYNIAHNEKVILFVGRLVYYKNTRLIIETINELKRTDLNFKMVFAGDGPDKDDMKRTVSELGLEDRVIFTGRILDRERLRKLYQRADLFLFPSVYDNAPIVLREASASLTPSLLVEGTNCAEGVVDHCNGFLVKKPCKKEISKKILEILANEQLLKSVGEKASETLCPSWNSVVDKAYMRYEKIIREHQR